MTETTTPAVAWGEALARVGGDREFLLGLLTRFVGEMPTALDALERGLEGGDPQAVRATAHRLKGTALNLGALAVGAAAARLETDPSPEGLTELKKAAHTLEVALG